MQPTKLSFQIVNSYSCSTIAFLDSSYYNPLHEISNPSLQVITPFESTVQELSYIYKGVTILNSNNLGITGSELQELPDGIYTAKISVCPEEQYFYEETWYRTCLLDCKYKQALLKLGITECDNCFDPKKYSELSKARTYIDGIHANTEVGNLKQAGAFYKAAGKILDNILFCESC